MYVAAEPGQDGRGFAVGNEPTTTAADNHIGRGECCHVDTSTVVNVDAAITEVLGEQSRSASRSNRNWSGSTVTSMMTLMTEDVDVPILGISASLSIGTLGLGLASGPLIRIDSVAHGTVDDVDFQSGRPASGLLTVDEIPY